MTVRRPLVSVSGRVQELPAGDRMPSWTASGILTRDMSLASGLQAVTGVGFTPAWVLLLSADGRESMSVGFAEGAPNGGAVASKHNITPDTWNTYGQPIRISESSSDAYMADVDSFDADGFTLAWTRFGAITGIVAVRYLCGA